jgi:lipopolysaccharide export system permease protein
MPWSRVQYHKELAIAAKANPLSYIRPKTFIREFPGAVIYVGSKDETSKDGNAVKDVWIWQLDSQKRVVRFIRAESGSVTYDEASGDFVISLHNSKEENHDEKAPDVFVQPLPVSSVQEVQGFRLSLAKYFGTGFVTKKLQWMNYSELLKERARVAAEPIPAGGEKQRQRDVMKISLTLQDKINTALAVFSFAFLGVPLGIKVSRRETSANLAVAVMLALSWYFMTVMVGWLDQHPEYRPDLLIWVPNMILLSLGGLLLFRLDKAS